MDATSSMWGYLVNSLIMQPIAALQKTTGTAVSTNASAATAKALVEAKFTIALHRPRSPENSRVRIHDACKRLAFAKVARYAKPVGGKSIMGPSVRFAEEALKLWGNVEVTDSIVWEDDSRIVIHVSVLDLEANTSFGGDISLSKTVERRFADKDRHIIGERTNSNGDKVFIVEATEDEMSNKINAAKSKMIRNNGLRLVPQDIVEEAMALVAATLAGQVVDPTVEVKKIMDAFAELRIKPVDIEQYLGHKLDSISPAEINDLRTIYVTIKDGEATWASYIRQAQSETKTEEPQKPVELESLKSAAPVTPSKPTPKSEAISALRAAGVSVDWLRAYLSSNKLFAGDMSAFGDFEEFPAKVWSALTANNNTHLNKAIETYRS